MNGTGDVSGWSGGPISVGACSTTQGSFSPHERACGWSCGAGGWCVHSVIQQSCQGRLTQCKAVQPLSTPWYLRLDSGWHTLYARLRHRTHFQSHVLQGWQRLCARGWTRSGRTYRQALASAMQCHPLDMGPSRRVQPHDSSALCHDGEHCLHAARFVNFTGCICLTQTRCRACCTCIAAIQLGSHKVPA